MTKLYLTVDIEPDPWTKVVPLLEVKQILDKLALRGQKITFFVTGKIIEEYPDFIKSILDNGHEIGLHSYSHRKLISASVLKDELEQSRNAIKEFKIQGFRAPEANLPPGGLEILKSFGFVYDSSSYFPKIFSESGITELPIFAIGKKNKCNLPANMIRSILAGIIPVGSGLFSGLFPQLQQKLLQGSTQVITFLHPWQLSRHNFVNSLTTPYLWLYLPNVNNFFEDVINNYELQKLNTLL